MNWFKRLFGFRRRKRSSEFRYSESERNRLLFMPLEMFMVACAIITKHPEDFPCLKVVSRSDSGREISSRILFKAPKV